MSRRHFHAVFVSLLLSSLAPVAQAQFYKVYEWETPMQGWAEPSLWNTYIAKADQTQTYFGRTVSQDKLWAHALELEYGLTDRFTIGAYADFEDPHDADFEYVRTRFVGRYRFSNRYQRIFNPALYVEYYLPRSGFEDAEELETRLILERDFGDWRLALNPIVSKSTSGTAVNDSTQLGFAGGLYYRRHYGMQPGVELFSEFGPARDPSAWRDQKQIAFGTLNLRFANNWIWQVGVGKGLTRDSNDLTVKSILAYEFQTVRPSHWAK